MTSSTDIAVEYGNRDGHYFTEWRFDLLKELLGEICLGPLPGHSEVVQIEDAQIWYDAYKDFHRLSFRANGHFVEVRFYKVFSSEIGGEEHWLGCPRDQGWKLAISIRRKLGAPIPTRNRSG